MQDVIGITQSLPTPKNIVTPTCSLTQVLSITVTKKSNINTLEKFPFEFHPDKKVIIFNNGIKQSNCFLICQFLDADGNPFFFEDEFTLQGCSVFGTFFDENKPTCVISGGNTVLVSIDFNGGNACGKISFNFSNIQSTQPIYIFNAIPFRTQSGGSQIYQKITVTVDQSECGEHRYSFHPPEGIRFSSDGTDTVLECVLLPGDNITKAEDFTFTAANYFPLGESTAISTLTKPASDVTKFLIIFNFNGTYGGGSLEFHVSYSGKSIHKKYETADPQVINVPTTGGGN